MQWNHGQFFQTSFLTSSCVPYDMTHIWYLPSDMVNMTYYGAISVMHRLNSGIFMIFELSIWNLNLNSSDCIAQKIIWNDTKLEPIPWELNMKNQFFDFCVGVLVSGHHLANLSHTSKDAKLNSTSFDPYEIPATRRGKSSLLKTTQKFVFTWAEIAWVELKSNKLESLTSSTWWRYNAMHFRNFW